MITLTLCTAFIRQSEDKQSEELVFATDSRLSGGEIWNSGVKLFELPRKDCLICFSGSTIRTYPLILNAISSLKSDKFLANPHTDLQDVLHYISSLFTTLCNSLEDYVGRFEDALEQFDFLFGGWSWKANSFKVWKLYYNHDIKAFKHDEIGANGTMCCAFIGDEIEKAEQYLDDEIIAGRRMRSTYYDYEPFKVLTKMIRDNSIRPIGGAIQLAKIYPPGVTEFLGVMWPSINGNKTFLGRNVTYENNPSVKYIDPDTFTVLNEDIPTMLYEITEEVFGINLKFMQDCYPEGILKENLSKRDRYSIRRILQDVAYSKFVENQNTEPVKMEEDEL